MYDVIHTPDLIYRDIDGQELRADLHRPSTEHPPPVVLYVHGGGFQFGSRTDDADVRLEALAAHGVAVLSVDYRLAPDHPFPAPLEDLRAAVRWTRENAGRLDVDATRIGVWGASAGGLLASLLALTSGDDDDAARVQAVVAWFPLTDLLASASRSALESAIFPYHFEAALLGVATVAEVTSDPALRDRARQASPLHHVTGDAPPFLIAHGDRDRITPVGQSTALHEALVRAGVPSSLVLVGGAGHEDAAFQAPAHLALTAAWVIATLGS